MQRPGKALKFPILFGCAVLAGQNLVANKPERPERAVWITGMWNMAFMAIVTVVFVSLAPDIIHIFTTDSAIAPVGIESLRIISYGTSSTPGVWS